MRIAAVKAPRMDGNDTAFWVPVIKYFESMGEVVNDKKVEADIYVVLSGKFENPLCLKNGKRVLFYRKSEWVPAQFDVGWAWMQPLLKHYYDEMIDCGGLGSKEVYEKFRCLKTANS